MNKTRKLITVITSIATLAIFVTLAVIWPGFDAREVPQENISVWAIQTGEGKRYARINTELGELDTVKEINNPSQVIQHGDVTLVFTDGQQRYSQISEANPKNLDENTADLFKQSPPETQSIASAGKWIVFNTASGAVFSGAIGEDPRQIDPFAGLELEEDAEKPVFHADAVAINEQGTVVFVGEGMLYTANSDGQITEELELGFQTSKNSQLSFAGSAWVLYEADRGKLFTAQKTGAVAQISSPSALLQKPGPKGEVYLSDAEGMTRVDLEAATVSRVSAASGAPAQPIVFDGVVYGAWLNEAGGTLWASDKGDTSLDFAGLELGEERTVEFLSNGSRLLLNEQKSGWVWNPADGSVLPSSQHWRSDEETQTESDDVEVQRVTDPKPPVAEPDVFGVRPGRLTALPVLLNDHDPNEDVLSIIAESITSLEDSFGAVSLTKNEQLLVVDVAATARGEASFNYAITDGTASQGLNSAPTTVKLQVISDDVNTAPEWCVALDCLATWPSPQIAPGATVTVNVLDGWVDPEGDPVYLQSVKQKAETGTVLMKPSGEVTFQHSDPNSAEATTAQIDVTVADVRGATATKTLSININPNPGLYLEPLVVTGALSQRIEIDLAESVKGGKGATSIVSLTGLEGKEIDAIINRASLKASVKLKETGSFVMQATVTDGTQEATGTVRVSVIDPNKTPITTSPITAFIRPGEDATVDVMPAVSDPLGAVLMLSDLATVTANESSLSVDIIGQQFLRATGETANAEPGELGVVRYTVSDGSKLQHRTTQGEITFVLLPQSDAVSPIAVDDRVVVRAGAQIDIPVLENDSAPEGAQIRIDPASIVNEQDRGLAFATSKLVRYLAPDEPGDYSLSYTIYRLGYPALTDTARVRISVIGSENNTAPTPKTLEGRVHSGRSVSIPFDSYETDAEGDNLTLERIVTQPTLGNATVSAEGNSIIFTSAPGYSGQQTFSYQVRDSQGEVGVGEVRVGVLDQEISPKPVTYSDYVQVQLGAESVAVVKPLDNDIDPNGQTLTLLDVHPNAPLNSAEYETLEKRLKSVDFETGDVQILAGEDLGTTSYVYTLANASGDVSKGLIIVKVVREPVPDYPLVLDTILNAETLAQFANGIDVVNGQVSWATGDVSGLNLALWKPDDTLTLEGWSIAGSIPEKTKIIPFEVSGKSFLGVDVVSYGFLRVPGKNDINLSLRSAYGQLEVNEKESAELDLRQAVRIPEGSTLEVLEGEVAASGARSEASCVADGLVIRYEAGSGAPWQDTCRIPVKLATQSDYTYLSLLIKVIAEAPQPELRPATVTVSPGETQTYDLQNMVIWQGQQDFSSLQYQASYAGSQFEIVQSGSTLTITGVDAARPSQQENIVVSLASHQETLAQTLTLTVGPAPSTLPRGASVTQQCSQSGGSTSCTIQVIGQGGEVNPLPRTPLKLQSVSSPANCQGVEFALESATAVRASWDSNTPGAADCTGSFIVEDAQGRVSSGERAGQVILDLQGLPADPTRVDWVSYSATGVQLQPVSDKSSYPAVTGYTVTGGGKTVNCPASGVCEITGLQNGESTEFTARAENQVGSSRSISTVTAWAYSPPKPPQSVSWKPIPAGANGGRVEMQISGIDSTASSLKIEADSSASETYAVTGSSQTVTFNVATNDPVRVSVTPITKFTVPPESVGGGQSAGKHFELNGVHGIGAPEINGVAVVKPKQRSITVDANITPKGTPEYEIGFAIDGQSCTPVNTGETSKVYSGLWFFRSYTVKVCARHVLDGVAFATAEWSKSDLRLVIPDPEGSLSYSFDPQAYEVAAGVWEWGNYTSGVIAPDGYELRYAGGGVENALTIADLFPVAGEGPSGNVTVRLCETSAEPMECGPQKTLTPTVAKYAPRVIFQNTAQGEGFCVAENLATAGLVQTFGLNGSQYVEEITDGVSKWLRVGFSGTALNPVISPACNIPPPPPDPDPDADGEPPGEPGE